MPKPLGSGGGFGKPLGADGTLGICEVLGAGEAEGCELGAGLVVPWSVGAGAMVDAGAADAIAAGSVLAGALGLLTGAGLVGAVLVAGPGLAAGAGLDGAGLFAAGGGLELGAEGSFDPDPPPGSLVGA